MTELEKKALDCIKNHSHTLAQNATESDIEKREMELYLEGYKQCKREIQKENEQLQQKWLDSEYEKSKLVSQIKKMECCENCDGWDYIPNTGERDCIETCCSNRSNWRLRDRN